MQKMLSISLVCVCVVNYHEEEKEVILMST